MGYDPLLVASQLWEVHRPKSLPEGDVTYLVLLSAPDTLLCGHINGLITLSGGCIGILPFVNSRIPDRYLSWYDNTATTGLTLKMVKKELRALKKGS
jgi:hypothetical protein